MRRLAQFVRLRASRVCVRLASVVLSRVLSRVCVHLSRVRLASVCVCSRQGFRMRASASCVCVRLHLSCVCLRRSSCLASVSRLSSCLASVCVGRLVSRRSSCLASVCVGRLVSRRSSCLASVCLLVNACGNWLILCRSSFKEFKRFLLSSYYRCTYRLCRPLIF